MPETSAIFQIVLHENGYKDSLREIELHGLRILLSTVQDEFDFKLGKKIRSIQIAVEKGSGYESIAWIIRREFGIASKKDVDRLWRVVSAIVKRSSQKHDADYMNAFNELNDYYFDLVARYKDLRRDCALQDKAIDLKTRRKEVTWLRSTLPKKLSRRLGSLDLGIVGECIAAKKVCFEKEVVCLITLDKNWARIRPYLTQLNNFVIVIVSERVGA